MSRPLFVILMTIFLDAVGIGLIIPVIPDLLQELSHEQEIAIRFGFFLALYSLMQFLFSPILGRLSDRYGRRPVLLVSLSGAAVDYTVMAFTPSLAILYLGRMVAGITGANMAVATAYIADVSSEDERARHFGYLNGCFGLGFVAGPLLGGIVGTFSLRYPFLLAAVFNAGNFLLGLFVLPESRVPSTTPEEKKDYNPLASLRWLWGIKPILPFLLVFIILQLVGQIPGTIWVLYVKDRFGWDPQMVGFSLATFGIMFAVTQAFLTGPATKHLGEKGAIALGLISDGTGFLCMAFINQGWMVFAVMPLLVVGGIAPSALQALLSKQVSEDKQGELQGTLTSLLSLATMIGPVAVVELYASVGTPWKGIVWIAGALGYLFCFPALRSARKPNQPDETLIPA